MVTTGATKANILLLLCALLTLQCLGQQFGLCRSAVSFTMLDKPLSLEELKEKIKDDKLGTQGPVPVVSIGY